VTKGTISKHDKCKIMVTFTGRRFRKNTTIGRKDAGTNAWFLAS
jgi:hypothetical protein